MTYNTSDSHEVYTAMQESPDDLYPVTIQKDIDWTLKSYRYWNILWAWELHHLPGTIFMRQQELVTKQVFRALEWSPIDFSIVEFPNKYQKSDLVKSWDEIKTGVDKLLSTQQDEQIAA